MVILKNKFTIKIILSYIVLGALAVAVSFFLYTEYKNFIAINVKGAEKKKIIEAGTLINALYQADSFSRLALLTKKEKDFVLYTSKTDTLFNKIEELKLLTSGIYQKQLLDSVKELLTQKNRNIEQLRVLKLTSSEDNSLDDILKEIKALEITMGKNSLETMIKDPSKLTKRETRIWQSYVDWLNMNTISDTSKLKSKTVDSMLVASRYIVSEAKKENSKIRRSLQQKENELIRNDLNISRRLQQIITTLDTEVTRNNLLEKVAQQTSIDRARKIFKVAGIIGILLIFFFSYLILNDFFKAEKFKQNLKEAKQYSDSLLKSREQLIATVSHDLKTPLNTIVGYSELFENTPLNNKQKHYIEQITHSSNFINKLADDLLDLSKLDAGKLSIEHVLFSLEKLIRENTKAIQEIHLQKPIDLTISIDSFIKGNQFKSDPIRIRQIINNLVGNAFKFTEQGQILITAKHLSVNKDIAAIEIAVKDSGIGISKEKQQLIFKEFTQAETVTAHKFGGSGLGLAISKKLTDLLKGTLKVESSLGAGSTFILTLPLVRINKTELNTSVETPKRFFPLKALVIDDDPSMIALLSELFAQMNIECFAYTDFNVFLKNTNFPFDFVLTDIQMPGVNGFEVLNILRSGKVLSYKGQPVIAMTGNRKLTREEYLSKGFSEMLQKPFKRDRLVMVLNEFFSGRFSEKKPEDVSSAYENNIYNLALLKSFLNTEEALNEVLDIFYDESKEDLLQMENAVQEKDYKTITATAHKMLTMCRQLEAKQIIAVLDTFEVCHNENCTEIEMKTLIEALKNREELQF